MRVLIIGLDGVTFDVLGPLMDEGRMPRLLSAVASGASGALRSTTPPITPAAWTTFLTGKLPGSHGIIDFERYDPRTNRLEFNTTRTLDHVRNLWQILSDQGLKVGSVNVPMTFPAFPVNGFLISGFETPGPESDFVYPPDLKQEILKRWPDPTLRTKWRRRLLGGNRIFEQNLDYIERSFHQGVAITKFCGQRYGWDVLMVVLKLADNLQHKAWKYIDPRWSGRDQWRRERVKQAFQVLDNAVGELIDYAGEHDASVLIVSDHGHGSLEGKVQPNWLLKEWGYLSLRTGGARGMTRLRQAAGVRHLWDRMRGRSGKFVRVHDIAQDLAVDFTSTRACVMHAGMAGFLYINLAGRQPGGIVEPSDYEHLRDELQHRFLGHLACARDPQGRTVPLFQEVHKPEELYGCSRAEQPWLPDLILTPHESLAVIRKIRGNKAVRWFSYGRTEGTHRPDGIFVANGPGIAHGSYPPGPPLLREGLGSGTPAANIVDCAPTILAMLGLGIPDDMQGRVLTEIFETPPVVKVEPAASVHHDAPKAGETAGRVHLDAPPGAETSAGRVHHDAPSGAETPVYSEEELQKVTERLSDLGYLE